MDKNSSVQRVLIYRLGSLGDTIVSLPSLHLIERAFPRAEKRLLTNFPVQSKAAAAQTILDGSGLVDGYFRYTVGLRNLSKLLKLRNEIRAWQPDVLVYLMRGRGVNVARRDAIFFRLCGIRRQIGVPFTEEMQKHRRLTETGELEPEAARLARCIAELGDARLDDPASWDLRITEAEHRAAQIALEPAGDCPIIAISVGTKMQAKDWGVENWRALLAATAPRYPGYALALVGARDESAASEFAAEGWRSMPGSGPVINLCGFLSPRESAAVLQRARLFVGHDSGPMHMAAAVQTPCVAVFSARNLPAVWFPYGKQNRVIYHAVECMGCNLETCLVQKKKCIASITVDEVLAAVESILRRRIEVQMVDEHSVVQRVLIYRLGSLGDTIVSLPSLHLIERAFPRAEKRLLTNFPVQSKAAAAQTILDGSGLVDGYFRYTVGLRNLSKLLKLRNEIRAWQPDALVYLVAGRGTRIAKRDAIFFRWCGIKRQIGVPLTKDMQENRWHAATGLYESEAARLARCIAELGDARLDDPASWDPRITEAEHRAAQSIMEPAGDRPLIAISVGTKMQSKDWGVENWRRLLAAMAALYPGYALALDGAREESDASEFAAEGWRSVPGSGPVINLCGFLMPRESAVVFQRARFFVGHDSGPMHMAAAMQTPMVTIFSARNLPGIWYPQGRQDSVIYHKVDCLGCGLETCTVQKKRCLTSITVDEVLARVKEIAPPPVSLTLVPKP